MLRGLTEHHAAGGAPSEMRHEASAVVAEIVIHEQAGELINGQASNHSTRRRTGTGESLEESTDPR